MSSFSCRLLFSSLAIAACSGGPPAVDASIAVDAPSADAPIADAAERDAPSDPVDANVGHDASAGAASIAWLTEVEPRTIDGDVGIDWAFQYELAIDGDPFAHGLTLERCTAIAGTPEECASEPLSNLPGTGSVRFGVDPSTYAVGENHYRFRSILDRGGTPIDEDLLDLRIDVTSCTKCVGS